MRKNIIISESNPAKTRKKACIFKKDTNLLHARTHLVKNLAHLILRPAHRTIFVIFARERQTRERQDIDSRGTVASSGAQSLQELVRIIVQTLGGLGHIHRRIVAAEHSVFDVQFLQVVGFGEDLQSIARTRLGEQTDFDVAEQGTDGDGHLRHEIQQGAGRIETNGLGIEDWSRFIVDLLMSLVVEQCDAYGQLTSLFVASKATRFFWPSAYVLAYISLLLVRLPSRATAEETLPPLAK